MGKLFISSFIVWLCTILGNLPLKKLYQQPREKGAPITFPSGVLWIRPMESGLVETEFARRSNTHFVEPGNTAAEIWRLHESRAQFKEFHEIEEGAGGSLLAFAPGDRLGYKNKHIGVDLRH